MRLGQLARKYNINQDQVILFLNEVQADLSPFHHNSKLSNDIEDLLTDHFSLSPIVAEEPLEELIEEIPPEETTEEQIEEIPADEDEKILDLDVS
jgi:hypothetical protein